MVLCDKNKKYLGILLFSTLSLSACQSQIDDFGAAPQALSGTTLIKSPANGSGNGTNRALPSLLIHETISPENAAIATSMGFGKGYMIYQDPIDANDDGIFDGPQGLAWWISQIPDPLNFEGMISIDWEGRSLDRLDAGDTEVRDQFLVVLRYLKSQFPKARIGYYGFPKVAYWERCGPNCTSVIGDNAHELIDPVNDFYRPILDESTGWFPSLYQFYPNDSYPNVRANNLQYIEWNTRNHLRMRGDRTIPIYNTVWPRWHECCTDRPNHRIPSAEFIEQLRMNLDTSYNGRKIDGLYWWGADRYGFSQLQSTPESSRSASSYILVECGLDSTRWLSCLDQKARTSLDDFLAALRLSRNYRIP